MGVEFEDKRMSTNFGMEPEATGLTGWLISSGIASSKKSASKILLIIFVIFVLVTISVLVFTGGSNVAPSPPTPFEESNLI